MLRILRLLQLPSETLSRHVQRRNAGHSKWQNIKHVKGATDAERMRQFTKLSRLIKVAIVEGKSSDPEVNMQLASVLEQCKRANMPKTTIASSLKGADSSKGETLTSLHIRGPNRCSLLIDIATNNVALTKNQVASHMKKAYCKYDNSIIHDYSEKGILVCSPLKDSNNPEDDAMDHAIAAGAEEVMYDKEEAKLRFECAPTMTFKAKKALEELGYTIDSAIVEYLPIVKASLTDEQLELLSKFLTKIEAMPEVMKITDNIE